jgi:hypothetical protein
MTKQYPLTLRQSDEARSDFAGSKATFNLSMGQLARVPTRGDLAKAALGIIFCSAVLTTALTWIAWH